MKIRLCYRIEKEAGLAEDEHGNQSEAYNCIKLNYKTYNVPKKKYKMLVEYGRKLTKEMFNIDENLVVPITLNEYLDNTSEED